MENKLIIDINKAFLDNAVVNLLLHIVNTPLLELGKEKMIWEGCACERDNCAVCWIEKNP